MSGADDTLPSPAPSTQGFERIDPAHFVLGPELGRGGMGRVRVARDRRLGREVVVKELLHHDADARARFEREARITARLQHPGIVGVLEAGTWPDGEPFYTMRRVAGRPLDALLAEAGDLPSRLALLPHLLAAADALAYAHAQGIIHRDLKPANVLVGSFGETVVIDWGLAKELDGSDPLAPSLALGAGDQTVAGAVMGTPGYMPPEQARGERVDVRADVYALGAMLDHLLAGAPPYPRASAEATLQALIAAPPRPLVDRAPGAPPELVTIAARAMARAPGGRYPSAAELAHELRRYQTGQLLRSHSYTLLERIRRFVRRYRAPVAVATLAFAALATGGVFTVRAQARARAAAEAGSRAAGAAQRDAEQLIDFLAYQLKGRLDPLGRGDLYDDIATAVADYYAGRDDSDASGEALAARAEILRISAGVRSGQGQHAAALERYRTVLRLQEHRLSMPGQAAGEQDLAYAYSGIGEELAELDRRAEAIELMRTGLVRARAAYAAAPAAQRDLVGLSRLIETLGRVLSEHGQHDEAIALLREDVAMSHVLVAGKPDDATTRFNLGSAYYNLSAALERAGDLRGALAAAREDLALGEWLAEQAPHNLTREGGLADSEGKVAGLLAQLGRDVEARRYCDLSLAHGLRAAHADPKAVDTREILVDQRVLSAELHRRGGEAATARAELDRVEAALAELRALRGDAAVVPEGEVELHAERALLALDAGHPADGELRAAVEALRRAHPSAQAPTIDETDLRAMRRVANALRLAPDATPRRAPQP